MIQRSGGQLYHTRDISHKARLFLSSISVEKKEYLPGVQFFLFAGEKIFYCLHQPVATEGKGIVMGKVDHP